jgi:hypothetical protein
MCHLLILRSEPARYNSRAWGPGPWNPSPNAREGSSIGASVIRCFLSASKGHLTAGALEDGCISSLFSSNCAETSALGAWLTARQADCHRVLLPRVCISMDAHRFQRGRKESRMRDVVERRCMSQAAKLPTWGKTPWLKDKYRARQFTPLILSIRS